MRLRISWLHPLQCHQTKSDGVASVLEIRWTITTFSLLLLPVPLWFEVLEPVIGQIIDTHLSYSLSFSFSLSLYIYIYMCVCVCVWSLHFLYRHLILSYTHENSVCYCYTSHEMTDQFLWVRVQMNSYSSNWNNPYKSLIVKAGEFSKMQSDTLEERYAPISLCILDLSIACLSLWFCCLECHGVHIQPVWLHFVQREPVVRMASQVFGRLHSCLH